MRKPVYLLMLILLTILLSLPPSCGTLGKWDKAVSDDSGRGPPQIDPDLAVMGETVYAVWTDQRTGDWQVFFSKSTDGGSSWGDGMVDSDTMVSTVPSKVPTMLPKVAAGPDGSLWIVWSARTGEGENGQYTNIHYTYSADGGKSWLTQEPVRPSPDNQTSPDVVVTAGGVYVSWVQENGERTGDDVMLSRWEGGSGFCDPVKLNDNPDPTVMRGLCIAADALGTVHCVWEEEWRHDPSIERTDIYHVKVEELKPSPNTLVNDPVSSEDSNSDPSIYCGSSGDVMVVHGSKGSEGMSIQFARSLDGGETFHTRTEVVQTGNEVMAVGDPAVVGSDHGKVYVAWAETTSNATISGKHHIMLTRSANGGSTFGDHHTVDDAPDRSSDFSNTYKSQLGRGKPVMAAPEGSVVVLWEDYINDYDPDNGLPENPDILGDRISLLPNDPPLPPSVMFGPVSVPSREINVTWNLSDQVDFAMYRIHMSTASDFTPGQGTLQLETADRTRGCFIKKNLQPSTEYHFIVETVDRGGLVSRSNEMALTTAPNVSPGLGSLEPSTDLTTGDVLNISWEDNDPDDNALISIGYGPVGGNGSDFTNLVSGIEEDSSLDHYLWNVSQVPEGHYMIMLTISDGVNPPVVFETAGKVLVNRSVDPESLLTYKGYEVDGTPVSTVIRIEFSSELDNGSLVGSSVMLTRSDEPGKDIGITVNVSEGQGRLLVISVEEPLDEGERYRIWMSANLSNTAGQMLDGDGNGFWEGSPLDDVILEQVLWKEEASPDQRYQISGRVVDDSGDGVEGAVVFLEGTDRRTVTDDDGAFILTNIPSGEWVLVVEHEGMEELQTNVTVSQDDLVLETLEMESERSTNVLVSVLLLLLVIVAALVMLLFTFSRSGLTYEHNKADGKTEGADDAYHVKGQSGGDTSGISSRENAPKDPTSDEKTEKKETTHKAPDSARSGGRGKKRRKPRRVN